MELEAAHFWNLTPWGFDSKEPDEKAEMVAFNWMKNQIEGYHYDMAEKAASKKG